MDAVQLTLISIAVALAFVGWRLLNPPLRLLISDRGILDRSLRIGWIHWDEIEGAYQPTVDDRDSIRLKLRRTERLVRKLGSRPRRRARRPRQSVDVRLDLAGTDITPLEILQEILAHGGRPQGKRSAGPFPCEIRPVEPSASRTGAPVPTGSQDPELVGGESH